MNDVIRRSIKQMISESMTTQMVLGTVKSIDEQKRTCEVEIADDMMLYDVRLTPVDDASCYALPKVDSWVVIASLENSDTLNAVCMTSEIDKIVMSVNGCDIVISDGSIEINGGGLGGLIKIEDLVNKINAIEQDLNTIKTAFKSWTVAPNDGGAALKAAAATWAGQTITTTKKSDLENEKIKHG